MKSGPTAQPAANSEQRVARHVNRADWQGRLIRNQEIAGRREFRAGRAAPAALAPRIPVIRSEVRVVVAGMAAWPMAPRMDEARPRLVLTPMR